MEEWCLEAWVWLMRNMGGMSHLTARRLVLADTSFFPPTTTEGEARAAYLFDCVEGPDGGWPIGPA